MCCLLSVEQASHNTTTCVQNWIEVGTVVTRDVCTCTHITHTTPIHAHTHTHHTYPHTQTYTHTHSYDPATNHWTHVCPMTTRRLGVAVTVLDGHLYAIGGSDGNTPLSSVERLD